MIEQVTAQSWWSGGSWLSVTVGGQQRRIFCRVGGSGSPLTLLHGFPTSSLDWASLWDDLTARHRVVAFDFLGYGRSDKPHAHSYRLDEQTEVVLEVWKHLNIDRSAVVAYDYGAIVAQLLLAHHSTRLTRVVLMNAGLIPELYHLRPLQRLAQIPVLGALAFRLLDEHRFTQAWSEVFGPDHPLSDELAHEHWLAMSYGARAGDTQRRLLNYIPERKQRADELDTALHTKVPMSFLWGEADPVSGTVAPALAQRLQEIDLVSYAGVGHYPHLEVPDKVTQDILARTASYRNSSDS